MSSLTLSNACLAYGHVPLLDHADFRLEPGERVALIGRNGSGKTSLLRVFAGVGQLDDGEFWRPAESKLGYVPQEPLFEEGITVFDAVVAKMGNAASLLAQYHSLSHQLAERDQSPEEVEALLLRLNHLQEALEAQNAWSFQAQAEQVIDRFSLRAEAEVSTLSGGQKKRLAIAQALAVSPEILLLDEPTNHLDITTIVWLEEFLLSMGGALIFITHDRCFLDRVATRVVELDRGHLVSFPGSFAEYQKRKVQMLHDEALENSRFDKILAQEEVWIRKGVEARRTRNEGRVLRLEQLRRDRAARRDRQGQVELLLDAGDKSGKLVAELIDVHKRFGEGEKALNVVTGFSCRIQRGDKIGLIGPNGAGKTTLLRLILGELQPDSGKVRLGTKIQVAYFDQFRTELEDEATLIDVISPGSEYVEIGNERKHVIGYLGDFLFSPERARSKVKSLSGGERNRLLLARLFARPANVLVLDEPTNDLDIETLELLEELLQNYTGTLFLVSHDRAFLDNVVTQTIAPQGGGLWKEYAGGYQDWAAYCEKYALNIEPEKSSAKMTEKAIEKPPLAANPQSPQNNERARKLSYKETRELAELPERISTLETEQKEISKTLEDPALYRDNALEAQRLARRLVAIDEELLGLLSRWEELESPS